MDEKELTLEQVAARKGVSRNTVRKWIDDGVLPAYRNGAAPAGKHDNRPIFVLESDLGKIRERVRTHFELHSEEQLLVEAVT